MNNLKYLATWLSLFAAFSIMTNAASAFQDFEDLQQQASEFDGLLPQQRNVEINSKFTVEKGTNKGILKVTANIAPHRHIFSQQEKNAKPTKIRVESAEVTVNGSFRPNVDPIRKFDSAFNAEVEEFEDIVTWSAPIVIEGDPAKVDIEIRVSGQCCDATSCMDYNETATARFKGFTEPIGSKPVDFKAPFSHVTLRGRASTGTVKPGDSFTLTIETHASENYHVYTNDPSADASTTLFGFTLTNEWGIAGPETSNEPVTDDVQGTTYYEGNTKWKFEVTVPESAKPGDYNLSGIIGFQTCTESTCDPPDAANFTTKITVGSETKGDTVPVIFDQERDVDFTAAKAASDKWISTQGDGKRDPGRFGGLPVPLVLGFAFLAGLILNVMPCVLPVIGLKIMSFVAQAGENPGRVFMLNMVFALGLITVFMILATLAVFFGFGWGDLYTSTAFRLVMMTVVFVFGLSFLGVWEIPIPGFVGSGKSGQMAEKEGYLGAFSKGILTTLLATPCAGPLLIPAVIWAIAQPPWLTYTAFLALGLGMALPYLIIGAFPKFMSFLPKPGPWMETFKQVMGFIMMGTAVFLMGSFELKLVIPVLSFMVALGFACWWIGRTSLAAEPMEKAKAWFAGVAIVAAGYYLSFNVLLPQHELDWKTYSRALVEQELAAGNIVFIDFTADW